MAPRKDSFFLSILEKISVLIQPKPENIHGFGCIIINLLEEGHQLSNLGVTKMLDTEVEIQKIVEE